MKLPEVVLKGCHSDPSRSRNLGTRTATGSGRDRYVDNSTLKTQHSTFIIHNSTFLIFFLVCFLFTPQIQAQSLPIVDPIETYIRLLQPDSSASFNNRQVSGSLRQNFSREEHPWQAHPYFTNDPKPYFNVFTPQFTTTYNSDFSTGQNDGALWQGKGLNTHLSAGVHLEYGPVELELRPEFTHSANKAFVLAPESIFFSYPYTLSPFAAGLARIDAPQRFGTEPISEFHAGQSTLSLSRWGAALGISTANMWNGPALYNPLTLSNNAPGFFHAFLETDGPVHTKAGTFEGKWYWGGLRESDFFDENPANNLRYITGIVFNYSPAIAPNLNLGLTRTFVEYYPDGGLQSKHLFRIAQPFTNERFGREVTYEVSNSGRSQTLPTDEAIHMLTLFGRWTHPSDRFETWFEWGLNENSFDKRSLLTERVHTRSYVLGMLKRFELPGNRWLAGALEITQLENTEQIIRNNYPVWYEHLYVNQGFTHRGQVLGAGIGPGSNSQKIRVDYITPRGLIGLSVNRVVHNNDRLYRHYDFIAQKQDKVFTSRGELRRVRLWKIHEVEYRLGLHGLVFLPHDLELEMDLYQNRFYNRHNIFEHDLLNVNMEFTLRLQLPGFFR